MSKQHPNQDYYKTGGSSQSEGPDRAHAQPVQEEKPPKTTYPANPNHPAVMRSKKK
jgi:hypothetical protein